MGDKSPRDKAKKQKNKDAVKDAAAKKNQAAQESKAKVPRKVENR